METDWKKLKLRLKSRGWDPDVSIPGESKLEKKFISRVMIVENAPDIFIPYFFRFLFRRNHIFLGYSNWSMNRWLQAIILAEPHLLIGE